MKRTILFAALICSAVFSYAQVGTYPALIGARGAANPALCSEGQLFYRTDLDAIMICTTTNTWAQATNSGGALATPVTVANGGTGRATGTTAYALVATGTTATGAQQSLASGATTEILVGGGASALPVWTTATGTGAPVRAVSPTFTGTVVTFTSGTARTLANAAEIIVCTSTCTITVPASATAGMQACIQNDNNVSTVITLAAVSGVQFEVQARTSYKSANTALVSNGAVGNQICIVAVSATKWNIFSATGTWS